MPDPLRATIAIPTYNRADYLRQALASIDQQAFSRDQFEILVIDNNSSDHTKAVVAEFSECQPAPRYILETKQGLDHGRNRAIDEARGEILIFADDDIITRPDWITQMCAPFAGDTDHRVGAVGGEVIPIFPDGLPPWIEEWHAPLAFRHDCGPLEPRDTPMGANLAFPRWVFEKLGPFHTALDRSAENYFSGGDSEMIRRIRAANLEVWFSPAAAVQHQMPASRTTFGYASRHAFDSARSRVIDRAGHSGAKSYLLGRMIINLYTVVIFTLLSLINFILFRSGSAKKALVRSWRSCGYLYQIPRSLFGRI